MYSLSKILSEALVNAEYDKIGGISSFLPISSYAKQAFAGRNIDASEDEISLASLILFYHRASLIDIESVDVPRVMALVEGWMKSGALAFPDRHGRALYDRFNASFSGDRLEFLQFDQAKELTNGLQNGVYQVGRIVIGPVGVLLSQEMRMLPPDVQVPLWHCADPGCGMVHLVALHSCQTRIREVLHTLKKTLSSQEGPASDWGLAFSSMVRSQVSDSYFDVLPLITDTLALDDLKKLFNKVLRSEDGVELRAVISTRIGKSASQGSTEKVSGALSGNEIIHLLATLKTSSIINVLDSLILDDLIQIPKSETRQVKVPPPRRNSDRVSSISSLGVRSERSDCAAYLSVMIFNAYEKADAIGDLAWRCKVSNPSMASILAFMASRGPKATVAELILPTKSIYEEICHRLGLADSEGQRDNIEDRILWKAGFNVSRYDDFLSTYRRLLADFSVTVSSLPYKTTESDRERIRSSAVNAFAFTERFIEELLAFNAWYLTSDIFGAERFTYTSKSGLRRVPELCGHKVKVGDTDFVWSEAGGNALGTLLVFARRLINELTALPARNRDIIARPKSGYPHFASETSNQFPFKHTELWADADPVSLEEHVALFSDIVELLEKARTAEIRNGVQHYREKDNFPKTANLLDCVKSLVMALDLADTANFFPKTYWVRDNTTDGYGISKWNLEDYNGRKIQITLPYTFTGILKPSFDKPYVVGHRQILGEGTSIIILSFEEESSFAKFWEGYPFRPPVKQPRSEFPALGTATISAVDVS
jgi:hypothetical protein